MLATAFQTNACNQGSIDSKMRVTGKETVVNCRSQTDLSAKMMPLSKTKPSEYADN
jgi:hypothetical protein